MKITLPMVAATTVATVLAASSVVAPARAVTPGPFTSTITMDTGKALSGYDIATDSAGTAYVAWIADTNSTVKTVDLCVLPTGATGATGCAGGIRSISATDEANGRDLHVVSTAPGSATLVWFTQPTLTAGALTTATYAGGALGASSTAGSAPSNGDLKDLQVGPDGQIWAVTRDQASSTSNVVGVRDGLGGAPTNITAPFPVGNANLAFDGGQAIVEVDHYGSVTDPAYVTSAPSWPAFAPVAKTWTNGTDDVVTTGKGARLVTSEANSDYFPASGAWDGSTFADLDSTGDTSSCAAYSHDLVTDPSGRVADVTNECDQITVSNLADTRHAGLVRFPSGNTVAGGNPQIGSLADGTAWVAWSIEDSVGDSLLLTRVQLPAAEVVKTVTKKGIGRASLAAPVGCLPDVAVKPKAKIKAAAPYRVERKTVSVDGHKLKHGKLDGAKLANGSSHKIVLKATLAPRAAGHGGHGHAGRPGKAANLKVSATFTAC